MQEDYVNDSRSDRESITIMSLYEAEVIQNDSPDGRKYVISDVMRHTIAQYGSIKTYWDGLHYYDDH